MVRHRLRIIGSPPGLDVIELDGRPLNCRTLELDMHIDVMPVARIELYVNDIEIDADVLLRDHVRRVDSRLTDLEAIERAFQLLRPEEVRTLLDLASELIAGAMKRTSALEQRSPLAEVDRG